MSYERALLTRRVAAMLGAVATLTLLSGCMTTTDDLSRDTMRPLSHASPAPSVAEALAPGAIAVIGDTVASGYDACDIAGVSCQSLSWALGNNAGVSSVADRLEARDGIARQRVWGVAPYIGVEEMITRSNDVPITPASLVMVNVGSSDLCSAPASGPLTPAEFGAAYKELLALIAERAPDALVMAYSIPDLYGVWAAGSVNDSVVKLWESTNACPALLAEPRSRSDKAESRRAAFNANVEAYNREIVNACAATAGCASDGGAVHDVTPTVVDLSRVDGLHPSLAGQARFADAAWGAVELALDAR